MLGITVHLFRCLALNTKLLHMVPSSPATQVWWMLTGRSKVKIDCDPVPETVHYPLLSHIQHSAVVAAVAAVAVAAVAVGAVAAVAVAAVAVDVVVVAVVVVVVVVAAVAVAVAVVVDDDDGDDGGGDDDDSGCINFYP